MFELSSISSEPLKQKLKNLPNNPGVYFFKGKNREILYIGKAKFLKNRIRSYFQKNATHNVRIQFLVRQIYNIDWIITLTDPDAYILEDRLIKLHKPKYNIRLKDNKSYPFIKFTLKETYPRLFVSREYKNDGNAYFGPYNSAFEARMFISVIQKHFPLRTSKMDLDGTQQLRPCLNFQINRCLGPCRGTVLPEIYAEVVKQVTGIFQGKFQSLLNELKTQMEKKSEELDFERAAILRDQIQAVENIQTKSKKITKHQVSQDVFQIIRREGHCGVQVLFIRNGFLMKSEFFHLRNADFYEDEEMLRSVFSSVYLNKSMLYPEEILIPINPEELSAFQEYLLSTQDFRLKIRRPIKGEGKKLLMIAQKNAEQNIIVAIDNAKSEEKVLTEVQRTLRLKHSPFRIECFDISNTSGTQSVASMVVMENGHLQKKDYRKFRIKTVEGPDDFESLREVIGRRLERAQKGDWLMPNLIVIDGGKGQINVVASLFQRVKDYTENTDLIGLAKGRTEKRQGVFRGEEDYEYVVKPNQKNIITLKKQSLTLHFLTRIRDETHRFAIEYHRKQRSKAMVNSTLDAIPNIGKTKKQNLLKAFCGISKIKSATIRELTCVEKISQEDAQKIYQYFHPEFVKESEKI